MPLLGTGSRGPKPGLATRTSASPATVAGRAECPRDRDRCRRRAKGYWLSARRLPVDAPAFRCAVPVSAVRAGVFAVRAVICSRTQLYVINEDQEMSEPAYPAAHAIAPIVHAHFARHVADARHRGDATLADAP